VAAVRRVRFLRNPLATEIGDTVEEFLQILGGPASVFLDGRDTRRTRALVTLLHGNEPSGLMALFRWIKSGRQPAVNCVCIIGSVEAALRPPLFSHRMLPGVRDLNRCFKPPFEGAEGLLAEEILQILRVHHPEAVIDLHNTSGSGPAFGVCTHLDREHDALVALFTERMIVTRLNLGALMEISEHSYPTVTVEVGGRLDERAHELAWEGLCRYFDSDRVLAGDEPVWALEILQDPVRLHLNPGVTLAYGEAPDSAADVTLRQDMEHFNFATVDPDEPLGWIRGDLRSRFWAQDAGGRCVLSSLLRCVGGRLYPAAKMTLFMITTNVAIARSDCLFYAVPQASVSS
tara:strand:- start:13227 stop:14264 length:1038 start_codon:yes stop_codon:yes gene_type:complete